MSLDKTLFKALRAGGLGHKAALLLADRSSKDYLAPRNYDAEGLVTDFTLAGPGAIVLAQDRQGFAHVGYQFLRLPSYPMAVGTSLSVYHSRFDGDWNEVDPPKLYNLQIKAVRIADANGIPIAPVVLSTWTRARAAGAWTGSPAAPAGLTVTTPSPTEVQIVCSTAAHYSFTIQANVAP